MRARYGLCLLYTSILLRTSEDFGTGDWESDKGTVNPDDDNEINSDIDSLDMDLTGS